MDIKLKLLSIALKNKTEVRERECVGERGRGGGWNMDLATLKITFYR